MTTLVSSIAALSHVPPIDTNRVLWALNIVAVNAWSYVFEKVGRVLFLCDLELVGHSGGSFARAAVHSNNK